VPKRRQEISATRCLIITQKSAGLDGDYHIAISVGALRHELVRKSRLQANCGLRKFEVTATRFGAEAPSSGSLK
jgi:hypothetical protein